MLNEFGVGEVGVVGVAGRAFCPVRLVDRQRGEELSSVCDNDHGHAEISHIA